MSIARPLGVDARLVRSGDARLTDVTTERLGFAHRGASAHAPENTLRAFRLALAMGAPGIETDVWMTADEVPVLHHGGSVRRRPIASTPAAELPPLVPSLADLYAACGTDVELSLDLKDGRAAAAAVQVAQSAGHDLSRLWLCGGVQGPLSWRHVDPAVRLVAGVDPRQARPWTDQLARLRDGGIDAVNVRHRRWSKALVDSVHEHGLLAFGWDAQSTRRIRALFALGCDAVYSDHVDRLVSVLREERPSSR
ncbi:MAG: glycerophosphodiester phosphodiesterase [Frankiaceae bacterium]|nr:glycerophosphodiester phosphodiesterase [Frankiaceae bacterium]